jgi:hypothetical protein
MSVPIPHILAAAKHSDTIVLDDKVLDVLAHALRAFPEVEWACALVDEHEGPAVGLYLDPAFHHRLGDIWQALGREVADREGELSVILLSTPRDVRRARENGTVFFPGRRRSV